MRHAQGDLEKVACVLEWSSARTEEQGRQGLAPSAPRLGPEVQDAWKGRVDVGLQLGGGAVSGEGYGCRAR